MCRVFCTRQHLPTDYQTSPTYASCSEQAAAPCAFEPRRAIIGERAFGLELWLSARNRFGEAVDLAYGFGRAWRGYVDAIALAAREKLVVALAACATERTRRGVAALHFMVLAELRSHGEHGHRVMGPSVYFGDQHATDAAGQRSYLAKLDAEGQHQQGGLADRLGVSTRTVYRWWRILVAAMVWDSARPPRDAKDALLTKSGAQVYTQRWLLGGTPRVIVGRLPLAQLRRPARRPEPWYPGKPAMRLDEITEAFAFIDGRTVPY